MSRPVLSQRDPISSERRDLTAITAALATVVFWGSGFVGIRAVATTLSPGGIALGRLVVSTVLLTGVALAQRKPLPHRRDLIGIGLYGVLWLGIYSVALNAAERLIDAGTAAMLIATGPILIAFLSGLFLAEGFPSNLFLGCAIAFVGAVIIGVATSEGASHTTVGILLCAIAVLAYSVAVVVQKGVLRRASPFQVTWLGSTAATIACLPFAPALVEEASRAPASAIGWIVYLGAVPTAVGFLTWTFALRRTTAGRTGSFLYLVPVVATGLGWLLLGEVPPWLAFIGGALCLGGVFVARRPTFRGAQAVPVRTPSSRSHLR
jgi:drug/metabolite transporter (DMT)-like permease